MLSRVPVAAIWAATLITLFELGRVLFTIPTVFAEGDGWRAALALPGLIGAPLLILGVALTGLGRLGLAIAGWGHEQPVRRARQVAWTVIGGLLAAGMVFGIQPLDYYFWKTFRQKTYAGLAVGLCAVAYVAVWAVFAPALVRGFAALIDRLGDRLPRALDPRRGLGALFWTVLVFAWLAWPFASEIESLRTIDLGPLRLLGLWGLALVGFRLLPPRRSGQIAALVTGAALLLAVIPAAFMLDRSTTRQAIHRDLLLGQHTAVQVARLADGDGDGAPRAFGGTDCNDDAPNVRPGAYDAPGDNIDQNCTGRDYLGADPVPREVHPPAVGDPEDLDVILFTIDALRHDVSGLMPKMQALAEESIVFENAYAHGAATYWSIAAMFASTLPSRLKMGCSRTPEDSMLLLPEVLQKAGYTTSMFTGIALFFRDGLRQGIRHPNFAASNRTGGGWNKAGGHHQTSDIFHYIERGDGSKARKLFVWSHYYDPHYPYFAIENFPAADDSPRARYDAIVRYIDVQIGRLVTRLKNNGRWDRTILIITADHGEAFGEHGDRFHGQSVYDEVVKVPLLIRVPGLPARRISAPIGLMDVSTTLLDLLNIPIPHQWLGRSWVETMRGGAPLEGPVFSEILPDSNYRDHVIGMRSGRFKLIHRVETGHNELYDLEADPGEIHNIYDHVPEAEGLMETMRPYVDHSLALLARNRAGTFLPPGAPETHKRRCPP